MKPIAVQLYSIREHCKLDFLAALRDVADMGYAGVEFAGLHGCALAEVRQVMDDAGLRAAGAHIGLPKKETLAETVEMAQALGVTLVGSGYGADRFKTADDVKKAAADFQAAAEMLKPHGIGMVYHNHWWEMEKIDGQIGLDLLYKLAPGLLAEIDTYWASNFGTVDVPAFVRKHAARTPLLHIKDGPLVKEKAHTAVGEGKMDIPAVVAAADEKVLQWLIVELDRCDTDIVAAVGRSAKYLIDKRLGSGQ